MTSSPWTNCENYNTTLTELYHVQTGQAQEVSSSQDSLCRTSEHNCHSGVFSIPSLEHNLHRAPSPQHLD